MSSDEQLLPRTIAAPKAPPVKCQGIKTKLTPFIAEHIAWSGAGKWIEPFLGSGAVLFNIAPQRALVADTNPHIIGLYKDLQSGRVTGDLVAEYLTERGAELQRRGAELYYEVRDQFNADGGSLPFLFLNRSCFNGMMRFNSGGKFNVPFGKKPARFRKAYVTKVANQVRWATNIMRHRDYEFLVADFRTVLARAEVGDFVYLDPPYPGRHNDYFGAWSDEDASDLATRAQQTPACYALSMWFSNEFRKNGHIEADWSGDTVYKTDHYYHVGSHRNLRRSVTEALVVRADQP